MSNEVRIRVTADDKASKSLNFVGEQARGMATSLKLGGAAAAAGLLALGASSIKAASDFDENLNKVRVVFRESAKDIEAFATNARTNLGLSQSAALSAAGTFGNLFTAMKISRPAAAEMSQGILQLAADLASFNNIKPEEALEKLRAGLVGETEPLRTLGVNLSAAAVTARALAMGLADTEKALTPAMKAQAAYSLILEQTRTAQGDFARTSDGLANKQRVLTASFDDLKVTIGQQLLPTYQRVMAFVVNTVNDPAFQNGVKKWTLAIKEFVENFIHGFQMVVIPAFQWIINNRTALIAAIAAIGLAFAWVNPLGVALAGIVGLLSLIGSQNSSTQHATLYGQQQQTAQRLADLGVNVESHLPVRRSGLPPVRLGGEALRQREAEISGLMREYEALNVQIAGMEAPTKELNVQIPELTSSFNDLGASAGGATEKVLTLAEALEDGIITMAEAAELRLTPAMAGAAEAASFLAGEHMKAEERTFNLAKAISGLQLALENGETAFTSFTKKLVEGALELSRAAAAAIFGRPTREEAELQYQLAEIDRQIATLAPAGDAANSMVDGLKHVREHIQQQLTVLEAQNRVQQAQLTLADQTLLSEAEQNRLTVELTSNIRIQSTLMRELSDRLGLSLIPQIDAARQAHLDLVDALRTVIGDLYNFGYSLNGNNFDQRVAQSVRSTALGGGFNGVLVTA